MKIVFFGSPAAALPSLENLLQAGHQIELVITQPDKPAGRGKTPTPPPVKEYAVGRGIPVLQPARIRQDETTPAAVRAIQPDINVVVAYGQIIPGPVIYLPRFRSVNVHFSLLPKYRGAAPVQWAVLNGERKTGVTIFELNQKMDEGDILAAAETDILPRETARELERRLALMGAEMLVQTLARIDRVEHRPQEHSQATYAPRLKRENGEIDWRQDSASIDRMVRAFSPWPGAFTFYRGQRILIHAGEALAGSPTCFKPGQISDIRPAGPVVCCGSGGEFLIQRLQRENKKEMGAADFLRGTRLQRGETLG
jgi:methionyl-tRNA formyltransferase